MKLQSGRVEWAWLMGVPCGVSQGNSRWASCRVHFQDGSLRGLRSCSSGQLGAQPCLQARGFDPSHLGHSCLGSLGFLTAWWLAHRQEHRRAKWRCIALSWSNFASYIAPLLLYLWVKVVTTFHSRSKRRDVNLIRRREDCPSDLLRTCDMKDIGLAILKQIQSRWGNWILQTN